MAGGIRILRAIPGSTSLGPILHDFCRRGDGIVTAFSDSLLYVCRQRVPEDVPVEVVPFGKVVRDLLALCGEPAALIASSGYAQAAIAQACSELPVDSPFSSSAAFAGTHRVIADTLDELRDWGLDAADLAELSERSSPQLAKKLSSLAEISSESDRLMETHGRQTSDRLIQACLEAVPEHDGAIKRLLVFAQSDVPPLKAEWLKWVSKFDVEVILVLDRHATSDTLFPGAEQAARLIDAPTEQYGDGNRLQNNLFSAESHGGAPIGVDVVNAADPLAEAEWAVRGCLQHEEPHKTAIYVRDLDSYAPLIESAARRLGLPVRVHRRVPLLTNSYARLTLSVLEFCASGDVRSLRPILQSSYLKLDGAKRTTLDTALRDAYRMRVIQWDELRRWADAHEDQFPWLPVLLAWRTKAQGGPFEWRAWLSILSDVIRADERLPWSTSAAEGERRMRDRDVRARNRIEHLLGDYVSVQNALGPRLINLREVLEISQRLWSDADVSIPSSEIGVTVTNSAESISDCDTLFVLGMLEGVFPRRRSEDPVLTDDERQEISILRLDKPPLRDSHDKAQEERDEFYRVCAAAGNRIVFSYPAADEDRDNIPAFYLEEVKRAAGLPEDHLRTYPRPLLAPEESMIEADRTLANALAGPREYPPAVLLETAKAKEALLPTDDRFTPSELRDALQCPFAYVARRRLDLKPKRHQARWSSLRKLPQFADLLTRKSAEDAERTLLRALESQLDELHSDLPEWEIQLLRSGGRRLIEDWVRREMRARAKWPKDEDSLVSNVRFGEGLRDQMPGKLAKLKGSMAAVSTTQNYRVGHLYVSRAPETRELEETDQLYYGLHFLALYDGKSEPALELESMSGERVLLMLSRRAGTFFPSHQPDVKAIDLAMSDDASLWRETFYESVKKLLGRAVSNIRTASVEPIRGEHCTWCDYGELCRRSAVFSEDDSPFGRDEVLDEA